MALVCLSCYMFVSYTAKAGFAFAGSAWSNSISGMKVWGSHFEKQTKDSGERILACPGIQTLPPCLCSWDQGPWLFHVHPRYWRSM